MVARVASARPGHPFDGQIGDATATRDASRSGEWDLAAQTWDSAEFRSDWGLAAIKADYAYALGYTGAGVTVGVVDSGVDVTNPDLGAGNIRPVRVTGTYYTDGFAYDYNPDYTRYAAGQPFDYSGTYTQVINDFHGTHVTGTVGASRNGVGMHGVAFDAAVYVANTRDDDSITYGPNVDYQYFKTAYSNVAAAGARFINSSWGSAPKIDDYETLAGLQESYSRFFGKKTYADAASEIAAQHDVVQVWAAGNDHAANPDIRSSWAYFHPEIESNWLAVGAAAQPRTGPTTSLNVEIASYSDRAGIAKYWTVFAPGSDIDSTVPFDLFDDYHAHLYGTSMSAPHATGSLAILAQRYGYLGSQELRDILLTTAQHRDAVAGTPDANPHAPNAVWGWGFVDLKAAMDGPGQFLGRFAATLGTGVTDTWHNRITQDALAQRKIEDIAEQAQWSQTLTTKGWDVAPPTVTATIMDQAAFATGIARAKATAERVYEGSLVKDGAGWLTLAGADSTFSGGVILKGGTLELGARGAAGTGAIDFEANAQTLVLHDSAFVNGRFANRILDFSSEDVIDLADLRFAAGATATYAQGTETLTVTSGGTSRSLTLANVAPGTFQVADDGHHGVRLVTTKDTTAPLLELRLPKSVVVASSAAGASVSFTGSVKDAVDAAPSLVFQEGDRVVASGDVFGLGRHVVTALAKDSSGNATSQSFAFTVQAPGTPANEASFSFAFGDAKLTGTGGHKVLAGPDGVLQDVTGLDRLTFKDGTIQQRDGNAVVDDLFYSPATPMSGRAAWMRRRITPSSAGGRVGIRTPSSRPRGTWPPIPTSQPRERIRCSTTCNSAGGRAATRGRASTTNATSRPIRT